MATLIKTNLPLQAEVVASNRLYVGAFEAFQDIAADAYGLRFTFVESQLQGMKNAYSNVILSGKTPLIPVCRH